MNTEYQPKDNSGHLFRNDRKTKDTQPDFQGEGMINGEKMRIAAWTRVSKKNGNKFLSLKFSDPDEQGGRSKPRQSREEEEVF